MLSVIFAAEQLHRHEIVRRDRELTRLGRIRERHEAASAEIGRSPAPARRLLRPSWARPIGAHLAATEHIVACAV